jgi:hypothetical protein
MSHVFVLDEHAGKGLGKWLVHLCMQMDCAQLPRPAEGGEDNSVNTTRRKLCALRTKTAEGLYERYAGFKIWKDSDEEGGKDGLQLLMRAATKPDQYRLQNPSV